MKKKSIYMAQPNSQYGSSIYFPYAAGSLIAYAFTDNTIESEYQFEKFIYKKTSIQSATAEIEQPFILGLSCYVWNYEYNKALAEEVKKNHPDCIVVFGGHQINDKSDVIGKDYADYVMLGEGEENFRLLLLALCGKGNVHDIPNLIFKSGSEIIRTDETRVEIPQRVSPYLAGYFDEMLKCEELQFSAILETNRGCPNRCAFCDWGNIKARVRQYDIETVRAEIDWMAKNKIEYCYCADANFGLFERDEQTVEYLIKKHAETGYPQKFQATYSKNNTDCVFRINKRLNEAGMCKGATLSFQSLSSDVLENIYRKNMPLESFHNLMMMYNSNKIAAYSEIIIGLPGESYESFRDGIEKLLEYGQHMSINFFNCELLANSIMSDPEYIEKYKIKSVLTEQHQYHTMPNTKNVKEFSRIVVETSSMSKQDWVRCNVLSVFIRAFHNLGILQCFAIYLYYERELKYTDFYEALLEWAESHPNTVCSEILLWLRDKYAGVLDGTGSLTYFDEAFGGLIWPLDESAFLKVIQKYDRFYDEITPFLRRFVDNDLFDDLLKYQRAIIKTPYVRESVLELKNDLFDYFSAVYQNEHKELLKTSNKICIKSAEVPQNLPDYACQTLWYGRKGGQNIITDVLYIRKAEC